jgi:Zn-dependent M16 (insulinase) family peptidase
MGFEIDRLYNGFKLKQIETLEELNSIGYYFEHEKSGGELLYLKNSDDNKVFMAGFKTPPDSDDGLPHILEHCVLAGSRKFPTKDPFNDLLKSSMQTFLNAMTYSDKTVYPVASRNRKDFRNLMDVYLDAVFFPNIHEIEEIFLQEGWHYDISDKDQPLRINGVVYNEMKGAFSSPDSTLYDGINRVLFKDNQYSNNSGGVPAAIPELSYEKFKNFHKTYYHPSNTKIYIYGDGDILDDLKFINDEYLDSFEKIEIDTDIPLQEWSLEPADKVFKYSIDEGDETKDVDYLSYSFVTPKIDDPKQFLAMTILQEALTDSDSSPLKQELLKGGYGKDIFGYFDNEIQQPIFTIVSKFGSLDKKDQFISTINETLNSLVKDGIDKDLLKATLITKEFELRESQGHGEPKGLNYGLTSLISWIHGDNPFKYMRYKDHLEQLHKDLEGDYFESLITKYLINNNHKGFIGITPEVGLSERRGEELKKELEQVKNSLSEEQLNTLIEKKRGLLTRQQTDDSREDIDKIPVIELSDISSTPEDITPKAVDTPYGKYLTLSNGTSGIAYINHYFNITDLTMDELKLASVISKLLGSIDTENYNYSDLSNKLSSITGDFELSIAPYFTLGESGNYHLRFEIRSKILEKDIENYKQLLDEIIFRSKFDDLDRIKEVLEESFSELDDKIKGGGYCEVVRNLSNISKPHLVLDNCNGFEFYRYLNKLIECSEGRFLKSIDGLMKKIFTSGDLVVAVSSDDEILKRSCEKFFKLGEGFPERVKGNRVSHKLSERSEAFIIPTDVQYNVAGANMGKDGVEHKGSFYVAQTILSLEHLMNRVRLQGGAYGVRANIDRLGIFYMSSYRDPNIDNTFKAYTDSVQYLKELNMDDEQIKRYIIGTISNLDYPYSPDRKLTQSVSRYLSKVSNEYLTKEREEILNCTLDDVKRFGNDLLFIFENSVNTVLGSEQAIGESEKKFYRKEKLLEANDEC